MRKRLISSIHAASPDAEGGGWLEVEQAAVVEVTSEADAHPVEGALLKGRRGWRAAVPGVQTIRILFDEVQTIRRIRLVFREHEIARTQEFVLRWSRDRGISWKDVIRQQWNFSPAATVNKCEEYEVNSPSPPRLKRRLSRTLAEARVAPHWRRGGCSAGGTS
jgi:hypothetical protein